ncbi:MAG: OmpA family protein [Chitinophagales bacterium]
MKKFLAVLMAMAVFMSAGLGQGDEIRPAALGISFFLNDFKTAERIRTTSLSQVLSNKRWAKPKEMSPGLAITYFKGVSKHVDFAGSLAGSFVQYPFPKHAPFGSDKFLLEADASANLKMVSEAFWLQPYLTLGVGGHMYGGGYFGAFVPLGVGFKINFFDEAHLYTNAQYRVPITTETANYHFFYQIGIAGRIGKKKEPVVIVPPVGPADTDKDGIVDAEDKCPTVPGLAKYQGCPIPDTDKDGINDEEDKCPTVPGLARYQGCPLVDTDGDTVPDEEDKCPTEKGLPENFGCPKLEDYKFDAKKVQFFSGSATLTKTAMAELDKGVVILEEHPKISVAIEGHTDNTGTLASNQKLSEKRAAAVKTYLVKKGISADRLITSGHGQNEPIEDNKSATGRAANRRVVFRIAK